MLLDTAGDWSGIRDLFLLDTAGDCGVWFWPIRETSAGCVLHLIAVLN